MQKATGTSDRFAPAQTNEPFHTPGQLFSRGRIICTYMSFIFHFIYVGNERNHAGANQPNWTIYVFYYYFYLYEKGENKYTNNSLFIFVRLTLHIFYTLVPAQANSRKISSSILIIIPPFACFCLFYSLKKPSCSSCNLLDPNLTPFVHSN